MNILKRATYRTGPIILARWLGLRSFLRRAYFWAARPRDGVLPLELAGIEGKFFVRTPAELRIIESAGGAGGEQQVFAQLMAFLRPVDVVYDIGANVGLYTVLLSKRVGDAGQVIAFEPEVRTYEHLIDNLKLNERKNVRCFRKALGEKSGQASLYLGAVIGGGSLVHPQGGGNRAETVEISQGDELVAAERLPVPRVVKIDVEGFEHAVIQGLRQTLSAPACEMLCCEVHPAMLPEGITPESVLELVDSLGFRQIERFPRWDQTFHIVARKGAAKPLQDLQAQPLYVRGGFKANHGKGTFTHFPESDLVQQTLREVCWGAEQHLPASTNHSSAQTFAIIPSYDQPRCLLPIGDKRCTLCGLDMVQPRARRWWVRRALLKGVVKTGWKGWAWDSISIKRFQMQPLEDIVGKVTGEAHPEFAILVGRSGLYRKITVQVISPDGKVLCYAKLPLSEASGAHLQREAEVLERLGTFPVFRNHIPEVLHQQPWHDGYVVFQSACSGISGPTKFTAAHNRFLHRLGAVGEVRRAGEDLVEEVRKRWEGSAQLFSPEHRRHAETALQQAGEWLRGLTVPCGCMHGDFAPGNTRVLPNGELFVFDWELTEFDKPNLWDILNFHAVAAAIRQKPRLSMDWEQLGTGDLRLDRGLLRLYLVNSLCLLLEEGSVGRERAIAYRHRWIEEVVNEYGASGVHPTVQMTPQAVTKR